MYRSSRTEGTDDSGESQENQRSRAIFPQQQLIRHQLLPKTSLKTDSFPVFQLVFNNPKSLYQKTFSPKQRLKSPLFFRFLEDLLQKIGKIPKFLAVLVLETEPANTRQTISELRFYRTGFYSD